MAPVQVPIDRTRFFGREAELADIRDLLARDDVGLLTLTGIGGSGKTRLAIAVATEAGADFPDGVWFVDLAPIREPAFVPTAIAHALAVHEDAEQRWVDTLAAAIGGKAALMVLDNCEQVLDAMPLVGQLLERCRGLKVLATSREALGVHGEQELAVAPLPVVNLARLGNRPLDDVLAVLARSPAVALFTARAQATDPGFRLTTRNVPAVVELCRGLDGLPLAIELAAGRTRLLSPEAMVERLDQRLTLLTGGARDRPARQQTMRDSLAWSFEMLGPDEQAVLRRLGVFVGGFTLAEAEVVGGVVAPGRGSPIAASQAPIDVSAALDALVNRSLVRPLGRVASEDRLGLLETLRAFALEALAAAGEGEAARRALATAMANLAEEASLALQGPEFPTWMARLDAEQGNIREALSWSLSEHGDAGIALRIAGSLRIFWDTRGQMVEGRRWLDLALALPGSPDENRRRALNAAGLLAWRHGDAEAARVHFEEALAITQQLDDRAPEGRLIGNLGVLAFELGDFAGARERFEAALVLARQGTDLNGIAGALNNLGVTAQAEGDFSSARPYFEEAVVLYRQGGDVQMLTDTIENIALLDGDLGHIAPASAGLEEVLAVRRERGDRRGIATTLTRLSQFAHLEGQIATAARLIHESLALHREVGDTRGLVDAVAHTATLAGWPLLRPLHRQVPAVEPAASPPLEDLRLAVRLTAASVVARTEDAVSFTVPERKAHDANLVALRANLGRRGFEAAWATGEAIGLDSAVTEALTVAERLAATAPDSTETRQVPGTSVARIDDDGGLSPRELEVAMLIAADLTYRQIAERLSLSVKSIEKHMSAILAKLGAANRLEVAAWARARGLDRGGPPAP